MIRWAFYVAENPASEHSTFQKITTEYTEHGKKTPTRTDMVRARDRNRARSPRMTGTGPFLVKRSKTITICLVILIAAAFMMAELVRSGGTKDPRRTSTETYVKSITDDIVAKTKGFADMCNTIGTQSGVHAKQLKKTAYTLLLELIHALLKSITKSFQIEEDTPGIAHSLRQWSIRKFRTILKNKAIEMFSENDISEYAASSFQDQINQFIGSLLAGNDTNTLIDDLIFLDLLTTSKLEMQQ